MGRHSTTTPNRNSNNWSLDSLFRRPFARQLGDVWDSDTASQAFDKKELKSKHGGSNLKLVFRNATPLPLVLCWISEQSVPFHFYPLEPTSVLDNVIGPHDIVESSSVNHAFTVSLEQQENGDDEHSDEESKTLDPKTIVAGYRPMLEKQHPVHFVTISRKRKLVAAFSGCLGGSTDDDLHHYKYQVTVRGGDDADINKRNKDISSSLLGKTWDSNTAIDAYSSGTLRSLDAPGSSVRLAFRNKTPDPLRLCWINKDGKPHHFYHLEPCQRRDKMVLDSDKIENSFLHHAFAISLPKDDDNDESSSDAAVLDAQTIVGGYRPSCSSISTDDDEEEEEGTKFHLITIQRKRRGHLRKDSPYEYAVSVQQTRCDPTPVDSSNKHYDERLLGGWPVRLETNWSNGDQDLERRLESDLMAASKCLPRHARDSLQRQDTLLWVNKSLKYGPAVCPVKGRGMCFHPGSHWLVSNGMHAAKQGCIELYNAGEYMTDCDLWGPGGLLLHELSHAYHYKCLKDGYENEEIQECYEKAMEEKLYENVRVHGSQGPTAKAYACANCMEYFAELSVAFLGGLRPNKEHNKWFPFNRKQLQRHDPRAFALLERVWSDRGDHLSDNA